jgi:hypothetical protein
MRLLHLPVRRRMALKQVNAAHKVSFIFDLMAYHLLKKMIFRLYSYGHMSAGTITVFSYAFLLL